MMRFNPPEEPSDFDEKVRQPGNAWLAKNLDPKKRLNAYWLPLIARAVKKQQQTISQPE